MSFVFRFSARFELDNHQGKGLPAKDAVKEELPDFSGFHVLIVDDVKINRIILTTFLKETGVEMEEAENGVQAIEMYLKSPPGYYSLIFMDVQMPVMDGCAATREIRQTDRIDAMSIPVVAMTANVFKEDVHEVFQAGMNGHIGKPVDMKIVVEILSKYLH